MKLHHILFQNVLILTLQESKQQQQQQGISRIHMNAVCFRKSEIKVHCLDFDLSVGIRVVA